MIKKLLKHRWPVALAAVLFALAVSVASGAEYAGPVNLTPQLAREGKTLRNGIPLVIYRADPNPPSGNLRIPPPSSLRTLPERAGASVSVTYVAAGGTDLWGASCTTFPAQARTAFNAAAAVWANLLHSSVPITISACWSTLGSSSILGYSGGGPLQADFSSAPVANTWYTGALANALAGDDLDPSDFDMHLTFNTNFAWYLGTDGSTPTGQYDFMTVVMHEIGHGLNLSGSMQYSAGSGSWGYGVSPTYPNIYDTFMRDGNLNTDTLLLAPGTYANPSAALGTALTSNDIWFRGTNAMAANGGDPVKIYAPATWSGGSSYSHLDYKTFIGSTTNALMVYSIASGVAIHTPGPVTLGILSDLGWPNGPVLPVVATSRITEISPTSASGGGNVTSDGGDAVKARGICWSTTANPTTALPTCTSNGTGEGAFTTASGAITPLIGGVTYHVRAYATNSVGTSYGSDVAFIARLIPSAPVLLSVE